MVDAVARVDYEGGDGRAIDQRAGVDVEGLDHHSSGVRRRHPVRAQ